MSGSGSSAPHPGRREDDPGWLPAADGRPALFISLGTAFNDRPAFFRMCLPAFGDGVWQVAMAVGDRVDTGALGPVPGNIEVRPYFPQLAVLRHSDVFVSHAGMNSTMESLFNAVPLVTVPQMPEQEANAHRVEELGLGSRLVPQELAPKLSAPRSTRSPPTRRSAPTSPRCAPASARPAGLSPPRTRSRHG